MQQLLKCSFVSSSFMAVILPRSLISHGTRMNLGSSVPSQKTTSCKFGRWLKIFTTTKSPRLQPRNWKHQPNDFSVFHILTDSSFDSFILSHVHAHLFLNIQIFVFGPYIAWKLRPSSCIQYIALRESNFFVESILISGISIT